MLKNKQIRKFQAREAHVAVIGLGYVGLPLALTFAQAGYRVTGIEIDRRKVEAINRGESYIPDVAEEELAHYVFARSGEVERVARGITVANGSLSEATWGRRGSFAATTDYSVLAKCNAVSICVPTPLNKTGNPDISYIMSATESIARHLHPGMVIVLRSTTFPGTTEEVMLPILGKQATRIRPGDGEGEGDGASPRLEVATSTWPFRRNGLTPDARIG